MKEFLRKLENITLAGIYGFAFDTKIDSRLSRSAAKFIEKELINLGLKIISPLESAIVLGNTKHSELKELEEGKFHQIGVQVGAVLADREKMISA